MVGYHIGATSRRTRGSIRLRGTVPAITDTHDGCPNRERRSTNWITYNLRLRGAAKSFKQSAVTRDTFRRRGATRNVGFGPAPFQRHHAC